MSSGDAQLFEEAFVVTNYDQAKYDRVARITANSNDNATQMTLDINIELFPCQVGDPLNVVLATTLNPDSKPSEDDRGWRDIKAGAETASLADNFDYVCHGKIYKFEDGADGQSIKAYISFGGMLMMLEGPSKKLLPLRVDNTYLLVKK